MYRNNLYVHYPALKSIMVGFGSQDGGKLGNNKGSSSIPQTIIPFPFKGAKTLQTIVAKRNYSVILDSDN